MAIIYRPKQTGKTYELLKEHNNYNGYIVTMNEQSRDNIMSLAEKYNFKINFPLTLNEYLKVGVTLTELSDYCNKHK